jgi:hypothetical protein
MLNRSKRANSVENLNLKILNISHGIVIQANYNYTPSDLDVCVLGYNYPHTRMLYILFLVQKCHFSTVNGRFRVETTELRRVHVHSSLLVVTSNQNASNKKTIVLLYILIWECHIIYAV